MFSFAVSLFLACACAVMSQYTQEGSKLVGTGYTLGGQVSAFKDASHCPLTETRWHPEDQMMTVILVQSGFSLEVVPLGVKKEAT